MLNCSFSSVCDLVDIPDDEQKYNQRKVEKEKEQLIQINTDLSNQIISYRKQIDDTINIASNYDSILLENSKNSKEITRLKLEIQDLQNRLKISLCNNQELKKLMEIQKNDTEGKFIIESDGKLAQQSQKYERIINQMKIDHANEIENMKKEIEFYFKYKENLEMLFEAASTFFNIYIDSPKSLIQCIKNFMKEKDEDSQDSHIMCKIQKQQKLLNNFQDQITKATSHLKLKIVTLNQQVEDLKNRNRLLSKQNEDLTLNNEKLISDLAKQSAQTKLAIFEKETGQICPNGTTCQNAFEISKQILNANKEIKSLKKQNRLLQKKVSSSELKCKKYETKCKEFTVDHQEMEKSYQTRNKDLHKKAQELLESESKNKEMETSYFRYKNENSVKDQQLQAMRENVTMINDDLKAQLSKYTDLMKERDQLFRNLQQQKSNNEILDSRLKMEEDKRKETENRLQTLQQQLNEMNCVQTNPQSLVPPSIFASSEFPRELQCVLREVGESTTCNLTMKLSNAFSIIAKWYRSRCDRLESEFNAEHQNLTMLHSQIDYFLDFLKGMFPDVKINFDLLLTDESTRNILSESLTRIHEAESKKVKKKLENQLSELFEALNVKEIVDLKDEVFQLLKKFENSQKKLKNLRKIYKDKEKELEKALRNANSQYDNVSKTCVILENSKTDLQGQIFELEREKEKIRKQLENSQKEEIERIKDDYQNKIDTLNKEGGDLKKQIQALLAANENVESENMNLNEALKKLKKKKERLEKDIKFNDDTQKNLKEKWKSDKIELQKRYENLSNQTKCQIFELQEKIKNLTIKNSQYEGEIEKLKEKIVELNLRIKKSDTQMAAVRSETERDKKNIQSQLNAQMVSLQNEYRRQLEEKQGQFEIERRRIVDALARNFAALTDGMKIDINNIESVAQIVKKKVDDAFRREANLRRSANSNYEQSSEEGTGYSLSIRRKKVTSNRY